jgi:hypothetical protein
VLSNIYLHFTLDLWFAVDGGGKVGHGAPA